jgi:hypothetical protein
MGNVLKEQIVRSAIKNWIEQARTKLHNGGVTAADLDALEQSTEKQRRQSLLYLHVSGMSTLALVIATDYRAAKRAADGPRLEPEPQLPYRTVHDAIVDGWRVVQFPSQEAPIGDRELNIVGYQFILEKMEEFDD